MKRKGHWDWSHEKKSKRSNSPVAYIEELKSKKIELIIYAGNLPLSWDENDIKKFFEQYGNIIESRQIKRIGSFTGSALVKFSCLTDAEEAIKKLKGVTITGSDRPANIKWLDTEEQRLGIGEHDEHKLFVGSLPRQANSDTLYDVFSIFGKIQALRMEENQYWAFIDYERKESALLAIKYLNGQTYLHGSRIAI